MRIFGKYDKILIESVEREKAREAETKRELIWNARQHEKCWRCPYSKWIGGTLLHCIAAEGTCLRTKPEKRR